MLINYSQIVDVPNGLTNDLRNQLWVRKKKKLKKQCINKSEIKMKNLIKLSSNLEVNLLKDQKELVFRLQMKMIISKIHFMYLEVE